jgi:uncharacterized membrane protein
MSYAGAAISPRRISVHSLNEWLGNHWFGLFLSIYGLWVFTPFLAPILMNIGWEGAGKTIYLIYSFFCHQLPQRSIFLFGEKSMYSLGEIQAAWQATLNPMILRQFAGSEELGWKIAWSDRMISFYTSIWLFGVAWWPFRRKVKTLSWAGFVLLLLPMALDGITHTVSDLAGFGQGFRDSNQWLATLTGNILPASFYAGDMLGSFNSWARLFSGLSGGLGIAWLLFPFMFHSQNQMVELDKINYGAVLEQIKNQNSHTPGG